ncbi:MAG: DUF2283 domain-containing protein [Dehalococcoidia bacterium]
MKLHVDRELGAIHLVLSDAQGIIESEEVHPGVVLDFDAERRVVGVELLGLRDRIPDAMLRSLEFETS